MAWDRIKFWHDQYMWRSGLETSWYFPLPTFDSTDEQINAFFNERARQRRYK